MAWRGRPCQHFLHMRIGMAPPAVDGDDVTVAVIYVGNGIFSARFGVGGFSLRMAARGSPDGGLPRSVLFPIRRTPDE